MKGKTQMTDKEIIRDMELQRATYLTENLTLKKEVERLTDKLLKANRWINVLKEDAKSLTTDNN